MNRSVLLWVTFVAACGGRSGNGNGNGSNDGPDGGGSTDAGPSCRTVCWAPAPGPTGPSTPPPLTDLTETRCNYLGLGPYRCPTGFECTGTQVQPLGPDHTFTRAICEPIHPPSPSIVFDLAPPPPPPPGSIAVGFDFTLNGGAWPISASPQAGTILLSARGTGTTTTVDLPSQSGHVEIMLEPGDYDTFIGVGGADRAHYPTASQRGVLTVVADGRIAFDFSGQPLTYSLRLDGQPFPPPASGEQLFLTFDGDHAQQVSLAVTAPAPAPAGTIMLEPDNYRVTLQTFGSSSSPTFPTGAVVVADRLVIAGPRTAAFEVAALPIAGAVHVDGADLPPGVSASVSFGFNRFAVSATPPSRYQGRLWAGSYDVVLDTGDSSAPAVPRMSTRVVTKFAAGPPTLDIAATTTTFSATLTLNHATPPDHNSSRGDITLTSSTDSDSVSMQISSTGAAVASTRVYRGTYAVTMRGSGPLPRNSIRLAPSLALTAPVAASYNVDAGHAILAVLDGANQPADTTSSRGGFMVKRADVGASTEEVFEIVPRTGPAQVALVLEPGTWSVDFFTSTGYTGLPMGQTRLGDVALAAGGTTTRTFTTRSAIIAGEVRRGGLPLPPASPGRTRGQVMLLGYPGIELPATGPATFQVRVFPGIYDFELVCSGTCETTPPPSTTFLAWGIDFP